MLIKIRPLQIILLFLVLILLIQSRNSLTNQNVEMIQSLNHQTDDVFITYGNNSDGVRDIIARYKILGTFNQFNVTSYSLVVDGKVRIEDSLLKVKFGEVWSLQVVEPYFVQKNATLLLGGGLERNITMQHVGKLENQILTGILTIPEHENVSFVRYLGVDIDPDNFENPEQLNNTLTEFINEVHSLTKLEVVNYYEENMRYLESNKLALDHGFYVIAAIVAINISLIVYVVTSSMAEQNIPVLHLLIHRGMSEEQAIKKVSIAIFGVYSGAALLAMLITSSLNIETLALLGIGWTLPYLAIKSKGPAIRSYNPVDIMENKDIWATGVNRIFLSIIVLAWMVNFSVASSGSVNQDIYLFIALILTTPLLGSAVAHATSSIIFSKFTKSTQNTLESAFPVFTIHLRRLKVRKMISVVFVFIIFLLVIYSSVSTLTAETNQDTQIYWAECSCNDIEGVGTLSKISMIFQGRQLNGILTTSQTFAEIYNFEYRNGIYYSSEIETPLIYGSFFSSLARVNDSVIQLQSRYRGTYPNDNFAIPSDFIVIDKNLEFNHSYIIFESTQDDSSAMISRIESTSEDIKWLPTQPQDLLVETIELQWKNLTFAQYGFMISALFVFTAGVAFSQKETDFVALHLRGFTKRNLANLIALSELIHSLILAVVSLPLLLIALLLLAVVSPVRQITQLATSPVSYLFLVALLILMGIGSIVGTLYKTSYQE